MYQKCPDYFLDFPSGHCCWWHFAANFHSHFIHFPFWPVIGSAISVHFSQFFPMFYIFSPVFLLLFFLLPAAFISCFRPRGTVSISFGSRIFRISHRKILDCRSLARWILIHSPLPSLDIFHCTTCAYCLQIAWHSLVFSMIFVFSLLFCFWFLVDFLSRRGSWLVLLRSIVYSSF